MFRDQPMNSLIREVAQNSLDAADGSSKPVRVEITLEKIPTHKIPGGKEFRESILPLAKETWKTEKKSQILFQEMEEILRQTEMNVLKISDENTTGLQAENWESLIEQAGSSVKASDSSGGSFGIGKAAPFAVSDLRMVFYNTLSNLGHEQSIGVSKFVSYDLPDKRTTQGTGYLGREKKSPFNENIGLDNHLREKKGTDLYIFGFNEEKFPNWEQEMFFSVLDNFLLAIWQEKLEVVIQGEIINKNAVDAHIQKIQFDEKLAKQYADILSYYTVLKDSQKIAIPLPSYHDLGIQENEAFLWLTNQEFPNRKVLMTRLSGMKIFDKNRISGTIKFSGIFHAEGGNINRVLKQIENPNHDKWSEDRAEKKDKKNVKAFLSWLTKWIKDEVKHHYQEKIEEQVDAYGLSDFLPDDPSAIPKRSEMPGEEHFEKKNVKMQLKPLKREKFSHAPIRKKEVGELSQEEFIEAGIMDGELSGDGFDGGIGGENYLKSGDFGVDEEEGKNAIDFDQKEKVLKANLPRKSIGEIRYRVIERSYRTGEYSLVLRVEKDYDNLLLTLFSVGDSGTATEISVLESMSAEENHLVNGNRIYIDEIKAKKWLRIEIKINQTRRMKMQMEAQAHESKE
jgi:hypothetical protein